MLNCTARFLIAVVSMSCLGCLNGALALGQAIPISNIVRSEPVDFQKDILPILQRNCLACHSANDRQGDLVLESPEGMLKGGDHGPVLKPNSGLESLMIKLAAHQQEPVMPPAKNDVNAKNLTPDELGLLRLWIDQGAKGSGMNAGLSPKNWRTLSPNIGPVQSVAVSSDGQYAFASRSNRLAIYHVPTGRLVTTLSDPGLAQYSNSKEMGIAHRDLIQSMAVNNDGDMLASGAFREVKLWQRPRDVQTAKMETGNPVAAIALSPDRKFLATHTAGFAIQLWDPSNGQLVRTWPAHTNTITSLKFDPRSNQLLSTSADQSIKFWDPLDGKLLGIIDHATAANQADWVPSGPSVDGKDSVANWIVSGGLDPVAQIWRSPNSVPVKHDAAVGFSEKVVWGARGDRALMHSADGMLRVVEIRRDDSVNQKTSLAAVTNWKAMKQPLVAAALLENAETDPAKRLISSVRAATLSSDNYVQLWSLPQHDPLDEWRASLTAPANTMASTLDGGMIATAGADGTIVLWNTQPAMTTGFEGVLEGSVQLSTMNPSRTQIAIAGLQGGKHVIVIRALEDGRILSTLAGHDGPIRSLAFSADGSRIVSGSEDKTLRVWNVSASGQPEFKKFQGHNGPVLAVAFAPDGQMVASGGSDHTVRSWNLADNAIPKEISGHTAPVMHVGFSAGNQLFSVATDRTVRFWNLSDATMIRSFPLPATPMAVTMRPDGQRIAVSSDDKTVRSFQLDNGQTLQTLTGHNQIPSSLGYTVDGKRLLSASNTLAHPGAAAEAIVWDVEGNNARFLESTSSATLTQAFFGGSSDRFLCGDQQGKLNYRPVRFVRQIDGLQQPITALRFVANGQSLWAAAKDGSLRMFTVSNGQLVVNTNHGAGVVSMAFSNQEQEIATVGENGSVRLWQANGTPSNPAQLQGIPGPIVSGPVTSIAFSPDAKYVLVAVGGDKPMVYVVDPKTGKPLQRFASHTQAVVAMSGSMNAQSDYVDVLSISADSIWQWEIYTRGMLSGHTSAITSVLSVPKNPMQVYTASIDGTVRRWNLSNPQQPISQLNHGGPVLSFDVRPDGDRIATASDNKTVKLWNPNGQQIAELRGNVRLKNLVTRQTQQSNAAAQRVVVGKQRLDALEKDVPLKTESEKTAAAALVKSNQDVVEKMTALKKADEEKIGAEKQAIDATASARKMLQTKTEAEEALKNATSELAAIQKRFAQVSAISNANPKDEELKKIVADTQQGIVSSQQKTQQMQQAIAAPTQAAQTAMTAAGEAAQKAVGFQKPYNDAKMALKTAESIQNLASQQHVVATRELEGSRALLIQSQQQQATLQAQADQAKQLLNETSQKSTQAEQPCRAVRFSPDGKLVAFSGDFPSVELWDSETATPIGSLSGHSAAISTVEFLDPQHVLSGSADHTVRLWDLNPSWKLERTIGSSEHPELIVDRVMALDFSADGKSLLVGSGVPSRQGELSMFQVSDGSKIKSFPKAHDDVILSARFSPDGKRIASGGADKYLRTWDIGTGQMLRRFEGHTNYVTGVSWKGDGLNLISSSADQSIKVWESESADQARTIQNFGKQVTAVRYIGETDNCVSSCGDQLLRMHNAANGGLARNLDANSWSHCLDVTPDGNVLVAGAADGSLKIWNVNNGQLLQSVLVGDDRSKKN